MRATVTFGDIRDVCPAFAEAQPGGRSVACLTIAHSVWGLNHGERSMRGISEAILTHGQQA